MLLSIRELGSQRVDVLNAGLSMRNVMPLPELKEEIYQGLYVDKDLWMKMYHEIYDEVPILAAMISALLQDAEKEKNSEDIQVGILQGAIYTYMLYKAQTDSDDLSKQWGGV